MPAILHYLTCAESCDVCITTFRHAHVFMLTKHDIKFQVAMICLKAPELKLFNIIIIT